MKKALGAFVLGLFMAACGGGTAPPEEEVSATWTSGDDDPLETPDDLPE